MNRLLEKLKTNPDEPQMQEFFEINPIAISGPIYLLAKSVIRKFPLGRDWVTDFAYLHPTSGHCYLWLVEIESPQKKIFNKDDSLTAEFNHALQQTRDWLSWCSSNRDAIRSQIEPLKRIGGDVFFDAVPRAKLIYGRREEINTTLRESRWKSIQDSHPFTQIRTYDGIAQEMGGWLGEHAPIDRPCCVAYVGQQYVEV